VIHTVPKIDEQLLSGIDMDKQADPRVLIIEIRNVVTA
jgi:hypothetical protein